MINVILLSIWFLPMDNMLSSRDEKWKSEEEKIRPEWLLILNRLTFWWYVSNESIWREVIEGEILMMTDNICQGEL